MVRSSRSTGKSARARDDCGRLASSTQSWTSTAMLEEIVCTLSWSLKGGTCNPLCKLTASFSSE